MNEPIRIDVKYTLKDIRQMVISSGRKLTYVLYVYLIIASSFITVFDALVGVLFLIGSLCLIILPFVLKYRMTKKNILRNEQAGMQTFEFSDEACFITSRSDSVSIDWKDIFKVGEYRHGFFTLCVFRKISHPAQKMFYKRIAAESF